MKIFFPVRIFLFSSILLLGCATHPHAVWQVKMADRTALAFSGKGAAAGIMMDAYISGSGIAIGIAIDQGIAKTIAENIQKKSPDFSFTSLVDKQLAKHSSRSRKLVCSEGALQVVVDTYGFHTFAGSGDDVTAWLKMHFICNGKDTLINYPADFPAPKLAELNAVKTNPDVAYGLLHDAVAELVQVWDESLK